MRRVTNALLAGAYLCLALTVSLLVWRGGGGAGGGIATLFGGLGLAFALHGLIGRALGEAALKREIGALRDANRILTDQMEGLYDRMAGFAESIQEDAERRSEELTTEVHVLEDLVRRMRDGLEDRMAQRPGASGAARLRPPPQPADRPAGDGARGPLRQPRRPLPAARRQPAAAADGVLRELLAPARRLRPGDDAGRISERRRAGRAGVGDRQPSAVPLRADRAAPGQERPQGRHLLQRGAGLAGRRDLLPAVPRVPHREPRHGRQPDLRAWPAGLRSPRGDGSAQHGQAGRPRLPLLARQGQRPRSQLPRPRPRRREVRQGRRRGAA